MIVLTALRRETRWPQVMLHAVAALFFVVALLTYRDLHHNKFGPIIQDELLLAEDVVTFIGQPVVVVAAETRAAAR